MHARNIIPVALLLAGCSGGMPKLPSITPYQMDIQQGNVVTQEMIAKVQLGMTRSQVRFALGTPLIMDVFHGERWDYVYRYQKGGAVTEHRRIVVIFKDDKLVRIEGDVVPAGASGVPGDVKTDKPVAAPVKPDPVVPKPAADAGAPGEAPSSAVASRPEAAAGGEDARTTTSPGGRP
jgi:outer membrane protein assembly factor BamE